MLGPGPVRRRRQRANSFPWTPERITAAESGWTAPPPAGAPPKMAATHRPVRRDASAVESWVRSSVRMAWTSVVVALMAEAWACSGARSVHYSRAHPGGHSGMVARIPPSQPVCGGQDRRFSRGRMEHRQPRDVLKTSDAAIPRVATMPSWPPRWPLSVLRTRACSRIASTTTS